MGEGGGDGGWNGGKVCFRPKQTTTIYSLTFCAHAVFKISVS